jgi:PAS domain S-box-containing protein
VGERDIYSYCYSIALKDVLDCIAEAIFLLDLKGCFIYVNRQTCRLFGVHISDILGQHFSTMIESDDLMDIQATFQKCARDGEYISNFRAKLQREDGSRSIISWNLSPVYSGGAIISVAGSARDIVENILVDHQLVDILKNMNPQPEDGSELLHTEDSLNHLVPNIIAELLFTQELLQKDIDKRKRAEAAMARFVAILEATTDLVAITDVNGHLQYLNKAGRKLLGMGELEDVTSKQIEHCYPSWVTRILLEEALPAAAITGSWSGETAIVTNNGKEIPMLQVMLAHKAEDGTVDYYSTIMRDISARKQKEQELYNSHVKLKTAYQRLEETQHQLLQSEKMASIGQLAAGVAHEINNPIGYVYSNIESLERYIHNLFMIIQVYEEYEPVLSDPDMLNRILKAKEKTDLAFLREDIPSLMSESKEGIRRIKEIVQSLKDFSHVGVVDQWQLADLHEGLNSTLNIVWNELKYKADIRKEYGEIPEIECLPMQINQVFMNLLLNAAQAISQRGTITIRTGYKDETVWIEITDTGCGIPPENINRIFDPFFTTKPVGKGTGLGLSLAYGIIEKHGGKIEVSSTPGFGSSFRIWLPISRAAQDDDQPGSV